MENAMQNGEIYARIPLAMSELGAIAKNHRNTQQNYSFRGIDDVYNALNPVLRNNGIFFVPEVMEQTREERKTAKGQNLIYSVVKVKYTLYATDGSYITGSVVGEGMDSGDKATNKAMSAAMKYFLFQVFCIPTEEMIDSERDTPVPDGDSLIPIDAVLCTECGKEVVGVTTKDGKKFTAADIIAGSKTKFGKCLCWSCSVKQKNV